MSDAEGTLPPGAGEIGPAAARIERVLVAAQDAIEAAVRARSQLFGESRSQFIDDSWPAARTDLEQLRAYVRATPDEVLDRVGLGVAQGRGKLDEVRDWARRFRRVVPRDPKLSRKLFVRFAKCLNSLLGSLMKEIPVVGEIAKEFKEYLENAAEDRILEEEDPDVRRAIEADREAVGDDGF